MEEDLRVKTQFMLSGATLKVPEGFSHPFADAKADGTGSIIVSFGDSRMRFRYAPDKGEYDLVREGDSYSIIHKGMPILQDVKFVQAFCHSPYQANVSLAKFDSIDDMMEYLDRIVSTGTVGGIPISGSDDMPAERFIEAIKAIHSKYPDIPIGLTYRVCPKDEMVRFREAGLSEFKLSVGSTSPRIFAALQPDQDLDTVMGCLKDAVDVFGKGKVQTGLFLGLGESDEEAVKTFEDVSRIGVLADIKLKKFSPKSREEFEFKLGKIEPISQDRLIHLAHALKDIQNSFNLDTNSASTICLSCRCCNIVPFKDF
ncbi:MAG: radical SAM protein [Thermoplasmata archaeon]|nr:radical SAM protein [Thermoplasmata archaeon]